MAKAKSGKKRIGRPEGRKPLLNLRVEQAMLDKLREAAAQSGRTVAEETVARLLQSFTHADVLQAEVDMRTRIEDELHNTKDLLEQFTLLHMNIAASVEEAVTKAFEKTGLKPKDIQQ